MSIKSLSTYPSISPERIIALYTNNERRSIDSVICEIVYIGEKSEKFYWVTTRLSPIMQQIIIKANNTRNAENVDRKGIIETIVKFVRELNIEENDMYEYKVIEYDAKSLIEATIKAKKDYRDSKKIDKDYTIFLDCLERNIVKLFTI